MQAQDGTHFLNIGMLLGLTWKLESTDPAKGQIISKWFFDVFDFLQKNEQK